MNQFVQDPKVAKPASRQPKSAGRMDAWGKRNSAGVVIASSMLFENVSYRHDGNLILDDVSLSVAPGEVMCLLGPSGSGKTTLLRIAAGLIEQNTGVVRIDDQVVSDGKTFVPPENRGVGLVFQDYALFPHLSILENVEFGLTELNRAEAREQAMRVLSRVGMADRANLYPHVLSGGEQQRVALARTLAPRPGILLMDEPFAGLDSRLRDRVREQSLELLRETRATAIIVTHDAEEALRVADHIALIRNGQLVQEGTGHDLYYKPKDLFVARFFSELNVISAPISQGKAETMFGKVPTKGVAPDEGGRVFVAIRHSDLMVKPQRNSNGSVLGQITSRRFVGTSELLEIQVSGLETRLKARIDADTLKPDVKLVDVSAKASNMMVFSGV